MTKQISHYHLQTDCVFFSLPGCLRMSVVTASICFAPWLGEYVFFVPTLLLYKLTVSLSSDRVCEEERDVRCQCSNMISHGFGQIDTNALLSWCSDVFECDRYFSVVMRLSAVSAASDKRKITRQSIVQKSSKNQFQAIKLLFRLFFFFRFAQ